MLERWLDHNQVDRASVLETMRIFVWNDSSHSIFGVSMAAMNQGHESIGIGCHVAHIHFNPFFR